MRVALVSSDVSLQSGAARSLLVLARALREEGTAVPFLYLSTDGPLAQQARTEGLTVRITGAVRPSLRRGPLPLLSYALTFPWSSVRLCPQLRRDQIDLVHANEFLEYQAGIAGLLAGLPRLYHVRWPVDSSRLYRALAKLTVLLATDLVAVSRAAAEACRRACGRRPRVVYDPGPDTRIFRPIDTRSEVLNEFSLPSDAKLVTLVSKLVPGKGHDTFLASARTIAESFPAARFLIVGGELPGAREYAARVRRLAAQGPLAGRVVFAGPRNDVARLLAASDLLLHLPTVRDSFPGVVVEAMSCGCPVVASRIGGIPEQVTEGKTGLLVPPADAEAAAAAASLLLGDPDRRRRMGKSAREVIVSRYGLESPVRALVAIYRRMTEVKRRRAQSQA